MTDNPVPHTRVARIATVLAALLLLFLFIFPHRQVVRLGEELLPYMEKSTAAVIAGDWDEARALTLRMHELYMPYDNMLRLYIDHQEINSLQTRLLSCKNLAMAEDDQIIVDLEDAKTRLRYIQSVETLTIWNLF